MSGKKKILIEDSIKLDEADHLLSGVYFPLASFSNTCHVPQWLLIIHRIFLKMSISNTTNPKLHLSGGMTASVVVTVVEPLVTSSQFSLQKPRGYRHLGHPQNITSREIRSQMSKRLDAR